jgi:hypothetical protein
MRRGLICWDENELPLHVLQQRTNRLRQAMNSADCDAIILYTNFIRCAAVSWLTGFSPYWADGILVVTREGDPLFATTLSKRMGSWIQGVMPNGTVVTNPNPGQLAGKRLAENGARRIAVLELPDFPAGIYTDLVAGLPQCEFSDGSELFAQARSPADEAERRLLHRADEIAQNAIRAIDPKSVFTAGGLVAAAEKSARMAGAEEVYLAVAADLDHSQSFLRLSGDIRLGRRFGLRATVAYKGSWTRRIRTMSCDPNDLAVINHADAWFAELNGTVSANTLPERIKEGTSAFSGMDLEGWFVEAPAGTRPLRVYRSHSAGQPIVLTVKSRLGGMPWIGARLIA